MRAPAFGPDEGTRLRQIGRRKRVRDGDRATHFCDNGAPSDDIHGHRKYSRMRLLL
jgi:hypothetical protein